MEFHLQRINKALLTKIVPSIISGPYGNYEPMSVIAFEDGYMAGLILMGADAVINEIASITYIWVAPDY